MGSAGGMAGPAIPQGLCYGKEEGCDIIFLAGRDDDIWRLPAHKFLLVQVNPVFKAMLSPSYMVQDSPLPHAIRINDVEGRALDNLLRFLYNEPVPLQSVETAFATFYASHKYLCSGLARVCISYLSDNLNQGNVLSILERIQIFAGDYQNLENLVKEKEIQDSHQGNIVDEQVKPSAPSYLDINDVPRVISKGCKKDDGAKKKSKGSIFDAPIQVKESRESEAELIMTSVGVGYSTDSQVESENIQEECANLQYKCLLFVDQLAEAILSSEEMEDLNDFTLRLILQRDSLNVTNELVVFDAIMRWADKECKRKQLPLTPDSKRQVLEDAESIFLPRYLTMSLSEFNGGPVNSGILRKEEVKAFEKIIKEDKITVSVTCPKKDQVDNDKITKLVILASYYTPITLRPFIHKLASPRTPIVINSSSKFTKQSRKKRRVPLFQRWICFKNCCKMLRNSNPSSPANSNQSSPIRSFHGCQNNQNARRNQHNTQNGNRGHNEQLESHSSSFDTAVERLIICWAFFFD